MSTRQRKVGELLKSEVSEILRLKMKDPRLGFVTVTEVEVTADMQHARVFVSVLGSDDERAVSFSILKHAEGFVRQSLAKRLTLKTLPEIDFRLDTSVDRGIRILELLEQIKREDEKRSA